MTHLSDAAIRLAISNIAHFGDTDIFPYPIENHLFHDKPDEVHAVLREVDTKFHETLGAIPVLTAKELVPVGYGGFRQGTQLDPLWNAYLLSLVVEIGHDIERKRVPRNMAFSYRFAPDSSSGSLFDRGVGWHQYQSAMRMNADHYPYVLRCDISDFYPRIYHHRLENALNSATSNQQVCKRIMSLLKEIAAGPSYGLPVGGPAARLLSELLLNRVDRLMIGSQIHFIRFVDDYHIFADSREAAHSALITLTQFLLINEGLSLQKSKTRIMSSSEFLATSDLAEPPADETAEDMEVRTFRSLRIRFDPYSRTADEDYMALKAELSRFDIVGMLSRELAKSRIEEGLARRLITAIRHLEPDAQNNAIRSMTASLDLLYPIFPSVMKLCRAVVHDLAPEVQVSLFAAVRNLIKDKSYITQVPANLAFALRLLSNDSSEDAEILFASVFMDSTSPMIRRDLILIMAARGAEYWVSDCKHRFSTANGWERRSMLVASYTLGDEGEHWRRPLRKLQSSFDQLIMSWVSEKRRDKGASWTLPI